MNTKKSIISKYDNRDGLTIETFGIGASTKSSNGRFAFGGPEGATLFNPLNFSKKKESFNLEIDKIELN